MEILAIIPARGGSKGIPLKNIIKIEKKPLLYYTVDAALKSKLVSRTIVSTDDKKISKIAKFYGSEVIKRPKDLSGDKIGLEPAINHVLDFLKDKENYVPDLIIILQNTSPLRNSYHIDDAIKLLIKNKFDSVLSGFSYYTFLWNYTKNDNVKSVSYDPQKRPNHQNMKEQLYENGALFVSTFKRFYNVKDTGNILPGHGGILDRLDSYLPTISIFQIWLFL